jgi:hypothetical protein
MIEMDKLAAVFNRLRDQPSVSGEEAAMMAEFFLANIADLTKQLEAADAVADAAITFMDEWSRGQRPEDAKGRKLITALRSYVDLAYGSLKIG